MMVHPLHRLCQAVVPQMIARRAGKIVVYGSATATQRHANGHRLQCSPCRTGRIHTILGVEIAKHNVQANLIAQNYVENPVYYPQQLREKESFQKSLARQVPLGRLATAREDALFALFLASDESDFFVGQSIPFSGGWTQ